MSSWIILKRMLGWRQLRRGGWEWISVASLSPATVTATMGSVPRSAWGHSHVWHGAEQFPSEATDQECCWAHHTTKMYEIALAEKQDFWVLSQKGGPLPRLRWMLISHWATVTLFVSTWMWLLQLIIKVRIFIIPSGWKVFLAPECSSLTGCVGLLFSGVNWTMVHLHVLNMHFQSTQELHFMAFLKHILEGWCQWSLWNKYYLSHDLNLKDASQQRK